MLSRGRGPSIPGIIGDIDEHLGSLADKTATQFRKDAFVTDQRGESGIIDITEFLKAGDRSNFISIQPNDTYIIKQTGFSYILGEVGTLNTMMSLINIYLNLTNLLDQNR